MSNIESTPSVNLYEENRKRERERFLAETGRRDQKVEKISSEYNSATGSSRFQEVLTQKAEKIYEDLRSSMTYGNEIPNAMKQYGLVSETLYKYLKEKTEAGLKSEVIACLKIMIDPERVRETSCINGAASLEAAEKVARKAESSPHISSRYRPEAQEAIPYAYSKSRTAYNRYHNEAERTQNRMLYNFRTSLAIEPEYLETMRKLGLERKVAEAEYKYSGRDSDSYRLAKSFSDIRSEHDRSISSIRDKTREEAKRIDGHYLAKMTLAQHQSSPGSVPHDHVKQARNTLGVSLPKPQSLGLPAEIPGSSDTESFFSSLENNKRPPSTFGLELHLATYASVNGGAEIANSGLNSKEKALMGLKLIPVNHPARADLIQDAFSKGIISEKERDSLVNKAPSVAKLASDWENSFKRFADRKPAGQSQEEFINNAVSKILNGKHSLATLKIISQNSNDPELKKVLGLAARKMEEQGRLV
ncbi:MAG TPA: hypothetical protein PKA63_05185 [Oligoflexia bacterium]|nr:hypothetical protein [Oligoflexia bacterium]HMP48041.1 hypothetical protein [Oligoflexia bacterium]